MVGDIMSISDTFERHAQTALVLVLVALLLWVGSTTQSTAVHVAEMRVEIAFLKAAASRPQPAYLELSKRLDDQAQRLNIVEVEVIQKMNRPLE